MNDLTTPALPPLLPLSSGWYGKLPSRGDFVGRGLPRAWLRQWDGWLQRSLAHAAQQLGAAPLRERLQALPPWQCLVLPARAGDAAWCGVLVASNDRVGRVFPLLVAESYDLHALGAVDLGALRERGWAMVQGLGSSGPRPALKELEAAITGWAAQPLRRPEPDDTRPGCAIDHLRMQAPQGGSFWWRLDSDATDAPRADAWPPSEVLMLRLLGESAPG